MPITPRISKMHTSLRHRLDRFLHRRHNQLLEWTPTRTSFHSLPFEIGRIIYRLIFQDMRYSPIGCKRVAPSCPTMLLVSKTLNKEIEAAMLEIWTVVVRYEQQFQSLNRLTGALTSLRHLEIQAEFLQLSTMNNSSNGNGNTERELTCEDCWLSGLPKLRTVVVVATPPKAPYEGWQPRNAEINCDDGEIVGTSHPLTNIVQQPDSHEGRNYVEGEFWKEKANEAGRRIEWKLSVPFYVETIWTVIKGFWGWKGPRWRWNKSWVFGRMDFDEKVLRFEIEGWKWKYEFSQLLG